MVGKLNKPPVFGKINIDKSKAVQTSRKHKFDPKNKSGKNGRVTPRETDKFSLTQTDTLGAALKDITSSLENDKRKYTDQSSILTNKRKNNFSTASVKTVGSFTRTESTLEKIKDHEYERQMKQKEQRVNRIKESRRKYSRQKLKSKSRTKDEPEVSSSNIKKVEKAPSLTVIPKNSVKRVNKENEGPCNYQSMDSKKGQCMSKSSSVLVIPRMRSINSKLQKPSKLKIQNQTNGSYVSSDKDSKDAHNMMQVSYKLLSDVDKSKTQLMTSRLDNMSQSSILGQSSIGSDLGSDNVAEVEIEFCNSQYNSVLKLANRLKQEESKLQKIKPRYQQSTFSIERKRRK